MNKQELIENYTMEQLADMVVELESQLNTARNLQNEILFEERIAENLRSVTGVDIDEVRKTLQNTKEYMNNTYVEKLKDEIDSLKDQLQHKEAATKQIDSIICELFGIAHNGDEYTDDFKELLRSRSAAGKTLADFLSTEPIEAATELINAVYTRNKGEFEKAIGEAFGNTSGTIIEQMYSISELRQIAEHLLVYCNANGEEE